MHAAWAVWKKLLAIWSCKIIDDETFCKLAFQLLKFLGEESLNLGNNIISEDDYCRDIEAPSEPPPVNNLADVYQILFNILKGSGIDSMFKQYTNCMLSHIG